MASQNDTALLGRTLPTEVLAEIALQHSGTVGHRGTIEHSGAIEHRGNVGPDQMPPVIPGQRTGLRIVDAEDYDVWVLRWPTGTSVAPHDHGDSGGAFTVVSGELDELRWCDGLRTERRIGRGQIVTVEPGVIHDVFAVSRPAVSVHVYSPPLRSMSFYDEEARQVIGTSPVDERSEFRSQERWAGPGSL